MQKQARQRRTARWRHSFMRKLDRHRLTPKESKHVSIMSLIVVRSTPKTGGANGQKD